MARTAEQREYHRKYMAEYRKRKPGHARQVNIKHAYGVTVEQYDTMYAAQGGKCAICGTEDPAPHKHLGIDHCHATGKVRGLLCQSCNSAIGRMDDDPGRLRDAARYIERWRP